MSSVFSFIGELKSFLILWFTQLLSTLGLSLIHICILTYGVTGFPHTYFIDSQGNLQLYAPGMISAAGLQQELHSISPDLVPAPES